MLMDANGGSGSEPSRSGGSSTQGANKQPDGTSCACPHGPYKSSQCRLVTARNGCMALLQTCALAAHKPAGCAPLIWVGSKLQQQLHSCLAKGPACGEGRHRHRQMQGRGALARLLCGGSLLQQRMGRLQLACRWHTPRAMDAISSRLAVFATPSPPQASEPCKPPLSRRTVIAAAACRPSGRILQRRAFSAIPTNR